MMPRRWTIQALLCYTYKYHMAQPIIDSLNPQQKEAVLHTGGPLLILAGAGSGKTRVITHRYAHIAKKHSPRNILAVTFTNKAAGEMRARIQGILKKDLKSEWIGTFHSQCMRLLRAEIEVMGYRRDFSIYDDDDQCTLIRHILKEFKIHEALYKGILSRISSLKSSFVTSQEFLTSGNGFGFEEKLARVYVRYQDELKRCNALDFDDLIMITVKLFDEHPEVLKKYRNNFSHVMVDEFQDTNLSQYRLLKLLAEKGGSEICVVGDDDQSIYGFRGANVHNILNFEKDFPKAKVIKLEQNYRSTHNILEAAGHVISNNTKRKSKKLWCDRVGGEKICRCWFDSEVEEAKYIVKMTKELYLKGMYDYSQVAILYRINLQSRPIEDALRHERIPYRVLGGTSFYHRKEIKDITAYMRLVMNNDDNVSLRRIINTPPRGIGASTLAKIEQETKKKNTSLYASLREVIKGGGITSSAKEKLEEFVKLIETLKKEKYKDAAEMLRDIFIKSGYSNFAEEERAENVRQLIESATEKDIKEYLDMLSLFAAIEENDTPEGAVTLMTLHSAKGLEFPAVFIAGVEEGVLPYFKAEREEDVEEERRLLYVGMTRAKDLLWLTGAKKRRLYSRLQEQEPSRFLAHIPEGSCLTIEKLMKIVPASSCTTKKIKIFKPVAAYAVGARVKHPKWGVGVVRDCYGDGEEQKITVNFPVIGVKRLALKFANLERIR